MDLTLRLVEGQQITAGDLEMCTAAEAIATSSHRSCKCQFQDWRPPGLQHLLHHGNHRLLWVTTSLEDCPHSPGFNGFSPAPWTAVKLLFVFQGRNVGAEAASVWTLKPCSPPTIHSIQCLSHVQTFQAMNLLSNLGLCSYNGNQ